ncbi:MOSC domain-containing protein [Kitasatospora sp. YST-16]|uniref:MOSC domain-containing protein n=1 Tax=unclassified Kitasatospora TaxID=2633591 RepID=UPI0004C3A830|nr:MULTISPECIES: MOSC N-terminal beta barrel domain-containing protein [unclassified Kitasatospora]WAL74349.1 MOSC domain-containing protein [Kitasatospora sp. YST-16]WNW40415.1 MOSC domain-containing protein [Streptomyces sp. Li-HN-5-13]
MILHTLRRHPVKSLLGEEVARARIDGRGLDGDRRYALLDLTDGRIASAKEPRTWRRLLTLRAESKDTGVRITGPDGAELDDAALSALLGRPVRLIDERPPGSTLRRSVPEQVLAAGIDAEVDYTVQEFGSAAEPGSFFDFAPLHLVTTATLAGAPAARYRPNLVIEHDGEPWSENDWTGRELAVGAELRLRIIARTPRCAVPTLAHGPLPADPEALRRPARHNRVRPLPELPPLPCLGVYAQVLTPGTVGPGDRVRLY